MCRSDRGADSNLTLSRNGLETRLVASRVRSDRMNRLTTIFVLMLAAASFATVAAQSNAQGEKQLAEARHFQTVDGDLAAAVKAYQAVFDRFKSSDRAV